MTEALEGLPNARLALTKVGRQLIELERRENLPDGNECLGFLRTSRAPERLAQHHEETIGRNGRIWPVVATQSEVSQVSLGKLINPEVKANVRLAKLVRIYKMANAMRVNDDGTIEALLPDGSVSTQSGRPASGLRRHGAPVAEPAR